MSTQVVIRFRPQNEVENTSGGKPCVEFQDSTSVRLTVCLPRIRANTLAHEQNSSTALSPRSLAQSQSAGFTFDHVYSSSTTQEQIFNETAKPIVEDILQGYNGTLLAYGQTSSGKTYTMEGPDINDEAKRGIIPRIVHTIFEYVLAAPEALEFVIKVSYMEIYLERIRDLFDESKDNLQVHEDVQRGLYVKGVTEFYVSSVEETMEIMRRGASNRSVGHTRMNAESSRSHSVFTLTITQKDTVSNSEKIGKLNLVDLAGSEKVAKTHASGVTLEEAKMINKSLSALGLVINALTDGKSKHIPYRDSKLTRLLQESLGGNARTTVIINCSPSSYNEAETLSSLRFGARAKNVKNKAKVNVLLSVEELTKQLKLARSKILALEKDLQALRGGTIVPPSEAEQGLDRDELIASNNELLDKLAEKEVEIERLRTALAAAPPWKADETSDEKENEVLSNQFTPSEQQQQGDLDQASEIAALRSELEMMTEQWQRAVHTLDAVQMDLPTAQSGLKVVDSQTGAEPAQARKMPLLQHNMQMLTGLHRQLVEQSAASKLELAMAERKLAARNERLKFVEQQLVDASQAVSKRELEHKLQHARFESTIASLRKQLAVQEKASMQLNISQRSGRGVAHLLALVYSSQQCSTAAPWRTSRFTTTRPFAGQLLARPLCTEAAEPKPVAFPTPSPSQQQMKKHPLQHLGQIRRLPQFQQTLEYMFNLERIWDASEFIMRAMKNCGPVLEATPAQRVELLKRIEESAVRKNIRLSPMHYNCCVKMACVNDDLDAILFFVSRMKERGLDPDVITYSSIVHSYAKRGDTASSEEMITAMQANGVQPSIVTYTALLGGYHAKGDVAGAWRVYKTILEDGLAPVALTYKCLVRLFVSERHTLHVGLALYREMRGQGMAPDHVTFMALLRGLVRARDAENATLVFVDCVEAAQEQSARPLIPATSEPPDHKPTRSVPSSEEEEGHQLLTDMEDLSVQHTSTSVRDTGASGEDTPHADAESKGAVSSEIRAADADLPHHTDPAPLSSNTEHDKAAARHEYVPSGGQPLLDATAYNLLIEVFVHTGQQERAVELLDRMGEVHVQANVRTFNLLLNGCVFSNDVAGARALLKRMERMGVKPNRTSFDIRERLQKYASINKCIDMHTAPDSPRGFQPDKRKAAPRN